MLAKFLLDSTILIDHLNGIAPATAWLSKLEPEEVDIAAGFRNRYHIKLPDAFQATLARNEELTFVTRDAGDFKKIADLDVTLPYRI